MDALRRLLYAAGVAVLTGLPAVAQTITALPSATTPPAADDRLVITQGGIAKQIPYDALVAVGGMETTAANANNPTARANILYTPPSADGYAGTDGTITASTTNFNASVTAVFSAADVGKSITIRGAGANYFITTISLSNGGASQAVGDVVTLTGGVQVYITSVSGGVVQANGFDIVSTGNHTSAPTTIAQTATSGAGTGLVLNTAWQHVNHVTTIASFVNPQQVILASAPPVSVANAEWGYGTDYSAVIQAAINAGTPVFLPPGIVGHASRLDCANKSVFVGQGSGTVSSVHAKTTLMWLGAVGGLQAACDRDTVVGARIGGIQYGDFALDGKGAAAGGLMFNGVESGHVKMIQTFGHTDYGVNFFGAASADTILTRYDGFTIEENATWQNANSFRAGWPNNVNFARSTDASTFGMMKLNTNTTGIGVPFQCGTADHNSFYYIRARGPTLHAGLNLWGGNTGVSGYCRANMFGLVDAGNGGLIARSTGFNLKSQNVVEVYDRNNGQPNWVIEKDAELTVRDNQGRNSFVTLSNINFADLPTDPDAGYMTYILDSTTRDWGTIIAGGGGYRVLSIYDGANYRVFGTLEGTEAPVPAASTSILSKTSDTAYAAIPGLSVVMYAGKTYTCRASVSGSSGAGGGVKLRVNPGGGGPAVSSSRFRGIAYNGTTIVANSETTTLNADIIAANTVYTNAEIEGALVVTTTGTLTLQMAQNTANGTATTAAQNSSLTCWTRGT